MPEITLRASPGHVVLTVFGFGLSVAVQNADAQTRYVVPSGTTDPMPKTLKGTDVLEVQQGGALEVASSPAVTIQSGATQVTIANGGAIRSRAPGGQAVATSGPSSTLTLTLTNGAGGLIEAAGTTVSIGGSTRDIFLNNAGTIRSTTGRAVDLSGLGFAFNSNVTNEANAIITADGGEALVSRAGVRNAGTISTSARTSATFDAAVMLRANFTNDESGVVDGSGGGLGGGVGVLYNSGTITGRNGAGIASAGSLAGRSPQITNTGSISGGWNGVSGVADGDGIRVTEITATISNRGTIRGIGSAGAGNVADGIYLERGGYLFNYAGVIEGAQSGFSSNGYANIENYATISGIAGTGILLTGRQDDRILNGGLIQGGNGIAVDMGAGDDMLLLQPSARFVGIVDGGTGTDELRLFDGNGTLSASVRNFEVLSTSGNWRLDGLYDFSHVRIGGTLTVTTANLLASVVATGGVLVVDQDFDARFAPVYSGGVFRKLGTSTLTVGSNLAGVDQLDVAGGNVVAESALTNWNFSVAPGASLYGQLPVLVDNSANASFPIFRVLNQGSIAAGGSGSVAILVDRAANGTTFPSINIANSGVASSIRADDDAIRVAFNPPSTSALNALDIQNQGTIASISGQAIDLAGSSNGRATLSVVNAGTLRSAGADAVRTGQGTVLRNQGNIIGGQTGSGVRFDGYTTTVINSGMVRGGRGGLVGTGPLTLTNIGSITADAADGIALRAGGGSLNLLPGSRVVGQAGGVVIDNGTGGSAAVRTYLNNGDMVRTASGVAIRLVGNFDDEVINAGEVTPGVGAAAIDMGAGNDLLTLWESSRLGGRVDGGAGTDTLRLTIGPLNQAAYEATLPGADNFEQLNVIEGIWRLTGGSRFSIGTTVSRSATLIMSADLGGPVRLDAGATFVSDSSSALELAGPLSGAGALVKRGSGSLSVAEGTGYTGAVRVEQGRLLVDTVMPASVTILSAGELGGGGTVGSVSVHGGSLGVGGPTTTLTITGGLSLTASSTVQSQVVAAGQGQTIAVGGSALLGGAKLNVLAAAGSYPSLSSYRILSAAGGVQGQFGAVTTNLAFLTPSVQYAPEAVILQLARNDIHFATFAATPNQAAVGTLIEALGSGNILYDNTLRLTPGAVAANLATLTGEIYPTYVTSAIETAELIDRQVGGPAIGGEGWHGWATLVGGEVANERPGERYQATHVGVVAGIGYRGDALAVRAGFGEIRAKTRSGQLADNTMDVAVARADWSGSAVYLRGGLQIGWARAAARRDTVLGATGGTVYGRLRGRYWMADAEAGHTLSVRGDVAVEPFAGLRHIGMNVDDVTEQGAATALTVKGLGRDVTFADAGLRLFAPLPFGLTPYVSGAYRATFGDLSPAARIAFAGNAGTGEVNGLHLPRNAALVDAGLRYRRGGLAVDLGFAGTLSRAFKTGAGRLAISLGL